jgi:hypothetical protein
LGRPIAYLLPAWVWVAPTVVAGPDALIRHADLHLTAWLAPAPPAWRWPAGWRAAPGPWQIGLLLGATATAVTGRRRPAPVDSTYFHGTGGQVEAGAWLRRMAAGGGWSRRAGGNLLRRAGPLLDSGGSDSPHPPAHSGAYQRARLVVTRHKAVATTSAGDQAVGDVRCLPGLDRR